MFFCKEMLLGKQGPKEHYINTVIRLKDKAGKTPRDALVTEKRGRNSIGKMGRGKSMYLKQGSYHMIINSYYLLNIH